MGARDLINYYNTTILARIIEWAKNKEKKWVKMESTISKVTLGKIIWIPAQYGELSKDTHSIIHNALKICDNLHKREKWDYNLPQIPLSDTKYFIPGIKIMFGNWITQKEAQLKDIMIQDKMCTYQEFKNKSEFMVIDIWQYNQFHMTL